jgi:hypothetical protein
MKRIIQFWDGDIPDDISPLMNSWRVNNADCEYEVYNYQTACEFMEANFDKAVADSFRAINIPAMLCDVFRVAIILIRGGIYVDCGTESFSSITSLIKNGHKCIFLRKHNGWIWNGLIIAEKNNIVLKAIWARIEEVLLRKTDGNIWELTGPKLFMDVINTYISGPLNFEKSEINKPIYSDFVDVIEQHSDDRVFDIVNNLKHKGSKHWSKLQQIIPLFRSHKAFASDIKFNKKLIILLGQHNTESISIQQSLNSMTYDNPYLIYPKTGLAFAGHHKMSDIFSRNKEEELATFFDDFILEVKDSKVNEVVISSEFFSSGNELEFNKQRMNNIWRQLSCVCDLFTESKIVFYVRDQVSSIDSRINQSIKSRLCLRNTNVKFFLSNPSLDYNLFDEALSYFFPKSILTPRIFSKKTLIDEDICSDFSSLLSQVKLDKISVNKSIESKSLMKEFLKINNQNISVNKKMEFKQNIKKEHDAKNYTYNKEEKEPVFLLTDEQVLSISEFYYYSNRLFFDKYKEIGNFTD